MSMDGYEPKPPPDPTAVLPDGWEWVNRDCVGIHAMKWQDPFTLEVRREKWDAEWRWTGQPIKVSLHRPYCSAGREEGIVYRSFAAACNGEEAALAALKTWLKGLVL